jgi:hypothetical protein
MNKEAIRPTLPWIALGAIATVGLVYISDGPWQMYVYAGIGVILVSIRYIMDAKVEKEPQASIAVAFVFLALLWPAVALTFIFAPLFRDRSR